MNLCDEVCLRTLVCVCVYVYNKECLYAPSCDFTQRGVFVRILVWTCETWCVCTLPERNVCDEVCLYALSCERVQ